MYRSSRPLTQVEVLRSLPHQSSSNKKLRKWLAWAFMAEDQAFEKVINDKVRLISLSLAQRFRLGTDPLSPPQDSLSRSLLPHLLELVQSPPPSSAFNPPAVSTDSSNDVKLFQQATLLLISFTDLDDQLNVGDEKVEAQGLVEDIKRAVVKIDSKLREYCSASLCLSGK
jgi:hypothetical protein